MNGNPFAQPSQLFAWTITAGTYHEAILDAISELDGVLSISADVLDGNNVITAYAQRPINSSDKVAIETLATAFNTRLTVENSSLVEQQDWVSETQKAIRPITLGRFTIIGSHHGKTDIPHGSLPILLDAGAAFGTGEHATTSGCLLALDAINKKHTITRALDMGCGSAILGIAQAKLSPCKVVVADNDPVAVKVAKENCKRNHVSARVTSLVSEGFKHPDIRMHTPYDLIIANILARPVRSMATAINHHLAMHGYVILSGFYMRDVAYVLSRYHIEGISCVQTIERNGWATCVLQKAG